MINFKSTWIDPANIAKAIKNASAANRKILAGLLDLDFRIEIGALPLPKKPELEKPDMPWQGLGIQIRAKFGNRKLSTHIYSKPVTGARVAKHVFDLLNFNPEFRGLDLELYTNSYSTKNPKTPIPVTVRPEHIFCSDTTVYVRDKNAKPKPRKKSQAKPVRNWK